MSNNINQSDKTPRADEQDTFSPLAKRFLWADTPELVQRVIVGLGVLCAVLFVLDFIIHRHAYVPGEGLPGFYAIVGFVAFTIIVLGATQLRRLILRNEQYYSPYSVDAEHYPEAGLERLNHTEQSVSSEKADDLASADNQPGDSQNGDRT